MGEAKEQTENQGRAAHLREIARLSEDGLSVEIARYDGAVPLELRAWSPEQALRLAAAISEAASQALINRARLGLARSIA